MRGRGQPERDNHFKGSQVLTPPEPALQDAAAHALDLNDIKGQEPKAFRPPKDWSRRGEMTRIILSILRQAAEPLTTRDIALQLLVERALDERRSEATAAYDQSRWRGIQASA